MKKIIKYQCDFCKKDYMSKSYAIKHEKKCFKNPDSKSCITCEYLGIDVFRGRHTATDEELRNGDYDNIINYCEHHRCNLTPLRTNCKAYKKLAKSD